MRIAVVLAVLLATGHVQSGLAAQQGDKAPLLDVDGRHQTAVSLARDGDYDAGLSILRDLLQTHPQNYPIKRDLVIIYTWKDDCTRALTHFNSIRKHPVFESYFVLAVAECMVQKGRYQEAITLLESGVKSWPKDKELKQYFNKINASYKDAPEWSWTNELATAESDAGNRDWFYQSGLSYALADRTTAHVRFTTIRAADEQFDTGDLNRIGLGIRHVWRNGFGVFQEVSWDVNDSGEGGSTTALGYRPSELWGVNAEYVTYSEDLPLRAKAIGVEADNVNASADFHTSDYRWEGSLAAARYKFTDDNLRRSAYTELGYAFYIKPKLEQRIIGSYYRSTNTLDLTVYFNPIEDNSMMLTYKIDYVYDSSYLRHVDHLYISAGTYSQKSFGNRNIWSVRYQQNYDISNRTSISGGAAIARNSYDGDSERISSLNISITQKF